MQKVIREIKDRLKFNFKIIKMCHKFNQLRSYCELHLWGHYIIVCRYFESCVKDHRKVYEVFQFLIIFHWYLFEIVSNRLKLKIHCIILYLSLRYPAKRKAGFFAGHIGLVQFSLVTSLIFLCSGIRSGGQNPCCQLVARRDISFSGKWISAKTYFSCPLVRISFLW